MSDIVHLSRAPIVEAVIDVSVRFESARDPKEFQSFGELIEDYPNKQISQSFAVTIKAAPDAGQEVRTELGGYIFRSTDATRVVQSRPTGFSFSQLKPYESFEHTLNEAWRLWQLYRNRFRPDRITRLSVRYINRLELPGPRLDFDDFLTTGPRLPKNVPEGLAAFSTSLVVPEVRPGVLAIIRQAFDSAMLTGDVVPVILDIDVLRECDMGVNDAEAVHEALAQLRLAKNQLFFGSLTDRAVELFK